MARPDLTGRAGRASGESDTGKIESDLRGLGLQPRNSEECRVGKTRRLLMLGRATFSLGANETGLIRLRLNQRRIKLLLRGRTSRVIHLTVRVRDNAGNSSAKRFNLRLVRR